MSTHRGIARRLPSLLVGAVLLVGVAACASGQAKPGSGNPFAQAQGQSREIEIRIVNMNFNDATVWALVHDTRRDRLGMVTGKSNATFTLAWTVTEALRLEFDLIGGVRCVTDPLTVDPGEIIELQISVDPSQDPNCR